ncbi:sodium:solute symporter [Candidatus Pelagibacter sp.]|nr:sodium:solute symporter [Candidatus Pelagibacter sp.]
MNTIYLDQSTTIITLLLTSLAFATIGIVYSRGKLSINSYLNADRSIGKRSLTASLVASCFGVWILIGPSEAATWGGLGAIIGYGLGQALPFLAFITIGQRMRKIMPNGNTLTQFVLIRFGKAMFRLVLLLTIMYMFVYFAAEVTAIAKVVNLMSGFPLWQTSLVIIVATLSYTLYGGLRASIFTDKIQFIIIMILLIFAINHIFNSGNNTFSMDLINEKAGTLMSGKYFYGYTAGLTFFIAVFATNLFDQGVWQRVFAAKSSDDLRKGFMSAFFIVIPFMLVLGFFGILAVSVDKAADPSTLFFTLLLEPFTGINSLLTISILILVLALVISSMDTLINALSSTITIEGNKFISLKNKNSYLTLSKYLICGLSVIVFLIASKGYSVLFMFLFADLLCCAAVFPIFYGMFKSDVDEKLSLISVIIGLISGLLLFPNQTFDKSILIGGLFPAEAFPIWISTALLFWSFILATFTPMITVMLFKKNGNFNFSKIKTSIKE